MRSRTENKINKNYTQAPYHQRVLATYDEQNGFSRYTKGLKTQVKVDPKKIRPAYQMQFKPNPSWKEDSSLPTQTRILKEELSNQPQRRDGDSFNKSIRNARAMINESEQVHKEVEARHQIRKPILNYLKWQSKRPEREAIKTLSLLSD